MKNIMTILIILIITAACSATTEPARLGKLSATPIQIGELAYGGTGCPEGSIVIEGNSDNNSLNLLFDQYTAVAGVGGGRLARKSCSLAMPIMVPPGYQVGIVSAEFKGYASLPTNATGRITTEYFVAGSEGIVRTEDYVGSIGEEIRVHHESSQESGAIVWTPCGTDTNIRMNSSLLVRSNESDEEAVLSLDQASLIQLVIRQCETSEVPADQLQIDI